MFPRFLCRFCRYRKNCVAVFYDGQTRAVIVELGLKRGESITVTPKIGRVTTLQRSKFRFSHFVSLNWQNCVVFFCDGQT
jgi:hypothetical protein